MKESPKHLKSNALSLIIPFSAVPLVIYSILNFPFNNSSSILQSIGLTLPIIDTFENKLLFISKLSVYLGLLLGALIILTIIFRVSTMNLPIKHEDSGYVEVLNRCLRTTLEQSVVFGTFFSYVLLNFGNQSNISVLYVLALLWFAGRILSILGYIVGYKVNILALRTFGLEMNLFISLILGAKALGTGHFSHII